MNDFHCVISSSDEVLRLPEGSWPQAFPPRGDGWLISSSGRIAVRPSGPDHHCPTALTEAWRLTVGNGPDYDLACDLLDDTLRVERGHVGRRSVFLFEAPGLTLVTSRLPDLLASIRCAIDYGSALHYLSFGTPLPGHTLVDGVSALPAGHSITLRPGKMSARTRVFEILSRVEPVAPDADGVSAIAAAVDRAILRSCGERGDAALLLSAGIDSSYLAVVLGERVQACYTSSFPDLVRTGEYDDARRLSRSLGRAHHAVPICIGDARLGLERVLVSAEPRSAWSTIVHDHLCRTIAGQGHGRLLSGLGADEVFGGYFQYALAFRRTWQQARRIDPRGVRNPLEVVLGSPRWYRARLFTGVPMFLNEVALRSALLPPWRHWDPYQSSVHFYLEALSRKPDLHLFEAMIAHEAQHRIPDLLVRGFEAFSAENGLTSGLPFLDPDVMRRGAALGADLRFRRDRANGTTRNKLLWRDIASRRLPTFVMDRPPSTYDAPINDWLGDDGFRDMLCDAIRLPSLRQLGLFSDQWLDQLVDALHSMRDGHRPHSWDGLAEQAWVVATLSAWQDRTLDAR